MNKAKIISRYSVDVINYEAELKNIDSYYASELVRRGVTDEIINPILKKKDTKRTDAELVLIVIRKELEDEKKALVENIESYMELIPSSFNGDLGELDSVKPYYVEEDGSILQKWEVVKNDRAKISFKIEELKTSLLNSDYKVMKCYEATILKTEEMPYNVEELTAERQAQRDEINRLEAILKINEPSVLRMVP